MEPEETVTISKKDFDELVEYKNKYIQTKEDTETYISYTNNPFKCITDKLKELEKEIKENKK